jgi:hypothetical protein
MAKMIPPQYDKSIPSAAEKRIFHLLENDPGSAHWFVFHSMGLSKRRTGPYGEIDFVVLIPTGAVICLEVKGGRVSCKGGVWQTIDKFGTVSEIRKSPFMQAREGMFALLDALREKFGAGSEACKCLFGHAVIFPDVDSPPKTPEFEPWESVGRSDLRSPISGIILKMVDAQRKKLGGWRPPASPESIIRDIRQFLRPDFECVVVRSTVVKECESAIVSLTEDQYTVLDMISNNERCLVEGAAGTGKTLLALEYSRRQASSGRKVLLLCFNRLLGDWFESCVSELGMPELRAGSYFRFLNALTMTSVYGKEFEAASQNATEEKIFSDLLPFYAQLSAEALNFQFDALVVDEAQDLLNAPALELLGTLLKGGLAGGQWYVFGDFTRQCIYGGPSREMRLQSLRSVCPYFTETQLKTNCRNTRRIGEETALLSGFTSLPYKLGQMDGLPVDYRYWTNRAHQLEKLSEVVRQLLVEGMEPQDIVLLSARKFTGSIACQLSCATQKHGVVSATEIRKGTPPLAGGSMLGFATVQSFKGMESAAIIFCDVEQVDNDAPQTLLYTGMSRARSLLIMMVHDSVRSAIAKSVMRRLNESWKS